MIEWIRTSGVGDVANVLGIIISLVGFILTLIGVRRSRKAAEEARDRIRLIENFVDFSAAITTLEEIKRLHRQGNAWAILPDRYASTRRVLIQVRASNQRLSEEQKTIIQSALVNLAEIERQVEKALTDQTPLKANKLNAIMSHDIDRLLGVLMQLKDQPSGGKS